MLLETAFCGSVPRLGLREHPGTAALDLDLSQPGATPQGVIGEPLGQPSFDSGAGVVTRVPEWRPQVQRVHDSPAHADCPVQFELRKAVTALQNGVYRWPSQ